MVTRTKVPLLLSIHHLKEAQSLKRNSKYNIEPNILLWLQGLRYLLVPKAFILEVGNFKLRMTK